jgi:hypothetical protein
MMDVHQVGYGRTLHIEVAFSPFLHIEAFASVALQN